MPVTSYIVRCSRDRQPALSRQLAAWQEVTLGPAGPAGLVVVTETSSLASTAELEERIRSLPGVLDLPVIYQHFEDLIEKAPVDSPGQGPRP